MLDDLRNSALQSFNEGEPPADDTASAEAQREPFLGMTASQRFVIALMLFFMVCILGAFALVIFEKVWLPIY